MRRSLTALAVGIAMLCGVASVYSAPQPQKKGTLTGVVLGPTGKPVANAVVTYQSGGGDTPHVVRTDAHGRFVIVKLRRDNYDLRASAQGTNSSWLKNVMVRTGENKSITLRLTANGDITRTTLKPPSQ